MKRRTAFGLVAILLVALVLVLAACGQQSPPPATSPSVTEAPLYTVSPTPTPTPTPTPAPTPTKKAPTVFSWTKATDYVGRVVTVQGPVAGAMYDESGNGQPTFLNIGRDYPDPARLVVVIWGEDRGNFPTPPEDEYSGATIRVTGTVTLYQGHAQIEVKTPRQIAMAE
jgi:hypothetical protein